jgi:4-diphosphocytidyl-2-C-methyl-D-erythritol kinase
LSKIVLKAPAKVNLFLEVLRKRSDGYHDIETILQEIDLSDTITLEETSSPEITVQCSNPHVPDDNANLAFKAALLLKKHLRKKKRGIIISIEKNIPVAAGLGGGSSDAAAVLNGLNKLWKINLPRETLLNLAGQIGMDVPFFIDGGLCLAKGRGEKLTKLTPQPEIWFVLAVPSIKVSTAWAYNQLSISSLTTKLKENRIILDAIRSADAGKIGKQLFNRLEEVTMKRHSEIAELKEKMLSAGAGGALMSGSGPSVFGIFSAQRDAKRAGDILKNKEEGIYVAKSGGSLRSAQFS